MLHGSQTLVHYSLLYIRAKSIGLVGFKNLTGRLNPIFLGELAMMKLNGQCCSLARFLLKGGKVESS